MTYPAVAFPDVEVPVVDLLEAAFLHLGETVTVGVGVPSAWTPTSVSHIQVNCDGTPIIARQVVAFPTVRLTAWAGTTGEAKRLAALAQGLLCSHRGGAVTGTQPLTGVLPTRDIASHAELASTTSRVTVRSAPIEPTGS